MIYKLLHVTSQNQIRLSIDPTPLIPNFTRFYLSALRSLHWSFAYLQTLDNLSDHIRRLIGSEVSVFLPVPVGRKCRSSPSSEVRFPAVSVNRAQLPRSAAAPDVTPEGRKVSGRLALRHDAHVVHLARRIPEAFRHRLSAGGASAARQGIWRQCIGIVLSRWLFVSYCADLQTEQPRYVRTGGGTRGSGSPAGARRTPRRQS